MGKENCIRDQSKSDSAVALTLINDIVLNITVSFMTENEKDKYSFIRVKTNFSEKHSATFDYNAKELIEIETLVKIFKTIGNTKVNAVCDEEITSFSAE